MGYSDNNNRIYDYYSDGSAARELEVEPERKRQHRSNQVERQRRRALKKAQKRNLAYLVILLGISAVLFVFCFQYVSLKNAAIGKADSVAEYRRELSELQKINDETEDDINSKINYKDIYNKATEYGMVYPSAAQVRTYEIEESGYVHQYKDIP